MKTAKGNQERNWFMFVILFTGSAISLRTTNLANILILTEGSNYKKWRREIGLLLTLNEFDVALDTPKPILTDSEYTG